MGVLTKNRLARADALDAVGKAGALADGGDMVGIDGMAQAETISQQRCSQEQRVVAKDQRRPCPSRQIECYKKDINRKHPSAQPGRANGAHALG